MEEVDEETTLSEAEIELAKKLREYEKFDAQKKMAWASLLALIVITIFLFLPIFPDSRISALSEIIAMFYIGTAGVVATFMGTTAWITRK